MGDNKTVAKQPKKRKSNNPDNVIGKGTPFKKGTSGNYKGRPKSLKKTFSEKLGELVGCKVPKAECDRLISNMPYMSKERLLDIVSSDDIPVIVKVYATDLLELHDGEHVPSDRKILLELQDRVKQDDDGGDEKTPISLTIFQQFHNTAVETKE